MLKISERSVGDVTILVLEGWINLGEGSNCLRGRIEQLLNEQKRKILLDVGEVTFVDSAGLGTLTAAHHTVRTKGGLLRLCHPGKKFLERLQITKLLTVFDVYSTEADALKSFGFPPVYCLCPVCGGRCGPSLLHRSSGAQQTCSNASCNTRFTIDFSLDPKDWVPIKTMSFQTYKREYFEIESGAPFTVRICGRLDLFSSSALQRCWQALPSPRRVVFNLDSATEINEAGRDALLALLAAKEAGTRAVISLERRSQEHLAVFPADAPFYRSMTKALKALGDVSDTPRWLARISEG